MDDLEFEYQGEAKHLNGKGFTKFDAEILSSIAFFYQEKNYLSPKKMAIVKKKIPKYWQQYLNHPEMDKTKLHEMIIRYKKLKQQS